MLEVRDLHVKFHSRDREAVAGVSFTLKDGEILGLVGESGSPAKNAITGETCSWTAKICFTQTGRSFAKYREIRSASSSRSP